MMLAICLTLVALICWAFDELEKHRAAKRVAAQDRRDFEHYTGDL
jgi:hypothetical protein